MKRTCVNVRSTINSASNISEEIIAGKKHIIVKGVRPIIDDIVMNGVLYPGEEIAKAQNTLERAPMPLDHPMLMGKNVSARDAQAINEFHVGAWLRNVRHENGEYIGDMVIDVRYAEASDNGQRFLTRINAMREGENKEPIDVSTGLLYVPVKKKGFSKGKPYHTVATNMLFDHVAILLDKAGAGRPKDGVGIFVNSDEEEIEVNEAFLPDGTEEEILSTPAYMKLLNKMVTMFSAANKQQEEEENPMKEKIITALKNAGKPTEGLNDDQLFTAYNALTVEQAQKTPPATTTGINQDEMVAAISIAVNAAVKPLNERLDAIQGKEDNEKRQAIKTALNMSDEEVKGLTGVTLNALYAKTQTSVGLSPAFNQQGNNQDDMADYIPGKEEK